MNEKQDLVCVFRGQAFEAEVVRARLEADGIPAMIMNNTMSAIFQPIPQWPVLSAFWSTPRTVTVQNRF